MAGYTPLKVVGNTTGLVQEREEFLLPDDAYPTLENAFVWREKLKRKQGFQFQGRLSRTITLLAEPNTNGTATYHVLDVLSSIRALQSSAQIIPGKIQFWIDYPNNAYNDDGLGRMIGLSGIYPIDAASFINYNTGEMQLNFTGPIPGILTTVITLNYYPNLPVMGLRIKELTATNNEETVAFDTIYAYRFNSSLVWEEYLPGTVWTGQNYDFFWSTNYWVDKNGIKIFWTTNFSSNDPIRYTNGIAGTNWINFSPTINAGGGKLIKCLCMLPFRGRMVVFNTVETDGTHTNRIRWAAIGNPFSDLSGVAPNDFITTINPNAWKDDIRGQGGFLDIPTSEDIISVGFVRDNLVIYCEHSTWQLRYTGRSIAPFQIEKVNSELGAESTFSTVQFDTSLVGVGDKGIVECDSFKSERIDIKIPDLVFEFSNLNEGIKRVHGIRNFVQKLAYWIYPYKDSNETFPDRRLVYNYENDSWAIFTDSLTCLGTFQPPDTRTWANTIKPWLKCNFIWANQPARVPAIVAGNQQGYILYLDGGIAGGQTTNDQSLFIQNIIGYGTTIGSTPVQITSPNHNMPDGQIISIINVIGTNFSTILNGKVFQANKLDANNFYLTSYNITTQKYTDAVLAPSGNYVGGGQIKVRDNFSIISKKFNHIDEGKQFQLGYVDILMDYTDAGAISLNVYADYNDNSSTNTLPLNAVNDTFFNSVIPTSNDGISVKGGSKNWKRVICPTNSNFITLEYTLNNEQMQNQCQESDVQIDAQIIWSRVGGRMGITQ